MKQEEKNQQSRERILRAAVAEFGTKGYDGASLNVLLSENGISKGLLYHYFQNKDQLYLSCVETCFDELTEVLSTLPIVGDAKRGIQAYFEVRARFFHEHPGLERIFFDALLQPPAHLEAELREAMAGFDRVNRSLFKDTLGSVRLREGLSDEDALNYFTLLQSALHLQYHSVVKRTPGMAGTYEDRARGLMELLLYGLAGREE